MKGLIIRRVVASTAVATIFIPTIARAHGTLESSTPSSSLDIPMAILRLLGYVALALLIGAVALLWNSPLLRGAHVKRTMLISAAGVAVSSIGLLFMHEPFRSGQSWDGLFNWSLLNDGLPTRMGIALAIRAVCAVLWVLVVLAIAEKVTLRWKISAISVSLLSIATFAFSGHQSSGALQVVFIPINIAHIGAVSVWVGCLLVMVLLIREKNSDDVVRRFIPMAKWSMFVSIISGVVLGFRFPGAISNYGDSSYGRLLILKIGLVVLVVLIGTAARTRLSNNTKFPIAKIIRREAVLLIVVLAVTSFLAGQPPDGNASQSKSFGVTLVQDNIVTELLVTPTVVGEAEVNVVLSPPDGALAPVKDVTVQFDLPSRSITVTMHEEGPNHWSGIVHFPHAGQWIMTARVSPKINQTLLFTTSVMVKD